MILLDTSVWIEFLNHNDKYFQQVSDLLAESEIICTDFIFGELLQGVRSSSQATVIKGFYENLPKINIDNIFIHAGFLSCKNQFVQKGIGLIDSAMIYVCYEEKHKLWTLDKKIIKCMNKSYLYKECRG